MIIACELYCCLLPQCEALRSCLSGFPIATTFSGVAHPLSTVCKGHYTQWSALPRLLSPNMASLDPLVQEQRAGCNNQHRAICPGAWQVQWFQWFQQDGATPHSSKESLAWLQQRFPDRLISRRCGPQWSPHSPDLNPPNFYIRGSFVSISIKFWTLFDFWWWPFFLCHPRRLPGPTFCQPRSNGLDIFECLCIRMWLILIYFQDWFHFSNFTLIYSRKLFSLSFQRNACLE